MMIEARTELAIVDPHAERCRREIDAIDVGGDELGAEPLGLPRNLIMSSGPRMPSGKPGKFSTSVVSMSWPPAPMPSSTTGARLARPA